MARALTIMMLVLGLSWACSKDQAPAMPGSGAVGKVVELAGDVTAKRGSDEPRALKVGETIYAKDTVTTGDDGSVTIVLEHNNARWTLAASKTQAVVDSLAAKAKKQEGSQFEQAGDDTTVTAGRNVENETASTAGTLARGGESAPAESASADDGAAAAPTTAAPRGAAPGSASPPAKPKPMPEPMPAPMASETGGKDKFKAAKGSGGLGIRGAGRGGGGTSEGTVGKGDGTIGRGGGGGTGSGYGTGANVQNSRRRSAPKVRSGKATSNNPDALPVEVARRFVRRHINELKYCYQQELKSKPDLQGRVELSFTVDTRGIVVKATAKAPAELDRLGKCMSAAARRWKFPKSKAKVTFTFPFVFSKS